MNGDPEFSLLKKQLIACTGLAYYNDRDPDLSERIERRLNELGLPDCAAYRKLLADEQNGPAELDVMVSRLNIGETYFFRDREQFDAIRDVVLPEIIDRKKATRQLRIWSAGCSNGAEPYSLAILLGDMLIHQATGWQISILATDINPQALVEAAKGQFTEWALRSTPEEVRERCFLRHGQTWTIQPVYKEPVSFERRNLVEGGSSWTFDGGKEGGFDLILCRNVMIYFSPEMRRRVIGQFHRSLAEGGWFLVGAVEHDLGSFTSFRPVRTPGGTLYRKLEPEPIAPLVERSSLAARPVSAPVPPIPAPPLEDRLDIDGLRQLANRGDWRNAVRYYHRLAARGELNPIAHYYHAVILEQMGSHGEAEKSLREAIQLDRNFLMAHHLLGLTLTKEKEPKQAALSFQNVLKLSFGIPDDQFVLEGAGMTVADLKELARMQLRNLGIA